MEEVGYSSKTFANHVTPEKDKSEGMEDCKPIANSDCKQCSDKGRSGMCASTYFNFIIVFNSHLMLQPATLPERLLGRAKRLHEEITTEPKTPGVPFLMFPGVSLVFPGVGSNFHGVPSCSTENVLGKDHLSQRNQYKIFFDYKM